MEEKDYGVGFDIWSNLTFDDNDGYNVGVEEANNNYFEREEEDVNGNSNKEYVINLNDEDMSFNEETSSRSRFISSEVSQELNVGVTKIEPSRWIEIFEDKREFYSKEEMLSWERQRGKDNNMVVVTMRSDNSKGKNPKILMACERYGKYEAKKMSKKNTRTKKCDCPFRLRAKSKGLFDN